MRGATVVRSVAATLAAAALISGLANLVHLPGVHHWYIVTAPIKNHVRGSSVPPLQLLVTATSLNPAEHRLNITLESVSYEFVPFADKEGMPIAENGTLLPEFADAALSIKVENRARPLTQMPGRPIITRTADDHSGATSAVERGVRSG